MQHPPAATSPRDRVCAALDAALRSLWRAQDIAGQHGLDGAELDLHELATEVMRLQSDVTTRRYRGRGTSSSPALRAAG